MPLVFEWDSRKAKSNQRKHGVSFDEACSVFDDAEAIIFPDEDHSNGEEREIIVGHSILERYAIGDFHGTLHESSSNYRRPQSDTERTEGL